LKESDAIPACPDQYYGWEKLYSEKLAEAFARDYRLNIRMARFHNVYGSAFTAFDSQKGKAPCHLIIKAIRHPKPEFNIWGDGEQTRSFLYIDDCIDGILALMDSEYQEPVNIGSDRLVTINQLANIIIGVSGKDIKPTYDLSKPQGVRGRNADLTLVKEKIGWQPKVALEDGLATVYRFAVDNFKKLEGLNEG
jgi:GDP-D-mannose 3',5'-epimerase